MTDYLPLFKPGEAVTFTASGTVTGGRLQSVTGTGAYPIRTCADSGADSASVVGTAGFDAVTGEQVTVFTRAGGVQRLTAAGAIVAGAKVTSAAGGKVQTIGAGANPIGLALNSTSADGDSVAVLFL